MKTVRFEDHAVRLDDHHTFVIDRGEYGIQVRVNDKWWMPPRPFPPGFDRDQVTTASAMPWHKADSIGEGDEYRACQADDVHASLLTLDSSTVHVSVVVAG